MCRGILLKLLKQGEITRIRESFDYIYLSAKSEIRRAQLENRGLASQEHSVEVQTPLASEEPEKIHSFFELGEGDYLLRRLEIVRRVKSGKSLRECSYDISDRSIRTFFEENDLIDQKKTSGRS